MSTALSRVSEEATRRARSCDWKGPEAYSDGQAELPLPGGCGNGGTAAYNYDTT